MRCATFDQDAVQDGEAVDRDVAVEGLVGLFAGRVLAFDTAAAGRYADLAVAARNAGRGFPTSDGYIAAIATANGFAVATRDEAAFEAAGVPFIDPWKVRG